MKWNSPQIYGQAPTPRTSHRCFAVQNKIIFFGGYSFGASGGSSYNDLHILNTSKLNYLD
jgi:hypothetical protein